MNARFDSLMQQSTLAAIASAKEQGSVSARLASLELAIGKVDGMKQSLSHIDALEANVKSLGDKMETMERQNFWRQNVGMIVGGLGGIAGALSFLATKL